MWADSHSRLTQCMKGTVSADYMWWVMRMACWGRLVWATRMACWGRLVSDPEIAVPSSLSLLSIRSHGPGGALTVQQDHPSVLSSTRHCL